MIVAGDPFPYYELVRARLGDWGMLPFIGGMPPSGEEPTSGDGNPPGPRDGTTATAGLPAEQVGGSAGAGGSTPGDAGTGVVLSIGSTIDGFRTRQLQLNLSDTKLNQLNIGVVGDLGTGKTQLLKSLIMQISASARYNRGIKPRFLIFDYKKDYGSDDFVAATGAKVIKPHRIPLNLFDTRQMPETVAPWLDRFRFFADVLSKIYSNIGAVQRDNLKRAVKSAYEGVRPGRQPTLNDVHRAYSGIVEGKVDSPLSIIGDLVDMEIFASRDQEAIPFNEFFDGVVVISLDALGTDDYSKNMLVAVMLNMFYENMLQTPKRPFIGSEPQLRAIDSYLLVDEADNIMKYELDVLKRLLLQGREFGAGVILASQYLRHFKVNATDYREPLLTWFVHKVPNITAAELSKLGLSMAASEVAERIEGLANHQCLYNTHDTPGEMIRGLPFFELMRGRHDQDS
ncbi:hypothetical protein [Rhizobium sp. NXC24]|uniref:hypothetical protein n=1 Tax=Rhizobium sp. NXC24 TaxID=2048897 RepID=UPI000CDF46EC|nr:hypothetical protein [Rhizobium sp. NXC24]AVA21300.1 AAA domain-containing protein [Rhizobium sp. NXC24]